MTPYLFVFNSNRNFINRMILKTVLNGHQRRHLMSAEIKSNSNRM